MKNTNICLGIELQKVLTAAKFAAKTSAKVLPLAISRARGSEKHVIEEIMTNGKGYKVMTCTEFLQAQGHNFKSPLTKKYIVCVHTDSQGRASLMPVR